MTIDFTFAEELAAGELVGRLLQAFRHESMPDGQAHILDTSPLGGETKEERFN